MADFGSEVEAFRGEARNWLEENYSQSLRRDPDATQEALMMGGLKPVPATCSLERPHGGQGRFPLPGRNNTAVAAFAAGSAHPAGRDEPHRRDQSDGNMGTGMFNRPCCYGAEEQKQRHIPPIVRGELRWCQAIPSPAPACQTSPRCRPRRSTRATIGRSTAKRPGPPAPSTPTARLVRTDLTKKHGGTCLC